MMVDRQLVRGMSEQQSCERAIGVHHAHPDNTELELLEARHGELHHSMIDRTSYPIN
jgi:hypothetical protein